VRIISGEQQVYNACPPGQARRGKAMSERLLIWRAVGGGLLMLVLLVAGCADKQSQTEEAAEPDWDAMVRCLATNVEGLDPDYWFYPTKEHRKETKTTVKAKLRESGARIKDGKVIDAAGQELYFFRAYYVVLSGPKARAVDAGELPPPPDPDKEMKELEKRYHVVPMFRVDSLD
jgi:hypothetical protein